MTRAEHRLVSGLTQPEVGELLDAVALVSEHIGFFYTYRPVLTDPNDEMVLETAVNGRASAIVTFNDRDFRKVTKRFGIEIISPREAWRRVGMA